MMMDDSDMGGGMGMGMMGACDDVELDGVIHLKVVEAKNLLNKENSERVGDVSDPYVTLFVDWMEETRTDVVQDSLNPKWNQDFQVPVCGSLGDLHLQVFDDNPNRVVGDHLGYAHVDLMTLMDEEEHDVWVSLEPDRAVTNPVSGDLVTGTLHLVYRYESSASRAAAAAAAAAQLQAPAQPDQHQQAAAVQAAAARAAEEARRAVEAEAAAAAAAHKAEMDRLRLQQEEMARKLAQAQAAMEALRAKEAEMAAARAEAERRAREQEAAKRTEMRLSLHLREVQAYQMSWADAGRNKGGWETLQEVPTIPVPGRWKVLTAGSGRAYGLTPEGRLAYVEGSDQVILPNDTRIYRDLDAGVDGTMFAIGADQAIYQWNQQVSAFHRVGGAAMTVSVGTKDNVVCVNVHGSVYSNGPNWRMLPGRAKQVAVGSDGTLFSVNTETYVFRFVSGTWTRLPGRALDVAVANKRNIWVIGMDSSLYQYQNGWKRRTDEQVFARIDMSEAGFFAVCKDGSARFAPCPSPGGDAGKPHDAAVVPALPVARPVAVQPAPRSFSPRTEVNWGLRSISVGKEVWGVSNDGRLWTWDEASNKPVQRVNNVGTTVHSNPVDGETWMLCGTTPFRYQDGACHMIQKSFETVSVRNRNDIWAVGRHHMTYELMVWHYTGMVWTQVPGKLDTVSVGSDGTVVGVKSGKAFRKVPTTWVPMTPSARPLRKVCVGSADIIHAIDQDSQHLVWDAAANKWIPDPDVRLIDVSCTADGRVWAIRTDGRVVHN